MAHLVETQWMGKMQFNADVNGHTVIMDGPEKVGGEDVGPIPKPLLLTALCGCTGMDVISLLRKRQGQVKDFLITARGETSSTTPIEYTSVHLVYEFKGEEAEKEKVLEAVRLSQEKYCGVSAMLKKIIPVTWEILFNGQFLFSNSNEEEQLLSNL